jgi:hypothetical protein
MAAEINRRKKNTEIPMYPMSGMSGKFFWHSVAKCLKRIRRELGCIREVERRKKESERENEGGITSEG